MPILNRFIKSAESLITTHKSFLCGRLVMRFNYPYAAIPDQIKSVNSALEPVPIAAAYRRMTPASLASPRKRWTNCHN